MRVPGIERLRKLKIQDGDKGKNENNADQIENAWLFEAYDYLIFSALKLNMNMKRDCEPWTMETEDLLERGKN